MKHKTLSTLALELLERKDREIRAEALIRERSHTNADAVMPHAFPITIQQKMWETHRGWGFENQEMQYHGEGGLLPSPVLLGNYRKDI
jgi:hypothetical protein